jgi:hypothetical protein
MGTNPSSVSERALGVVACRAIPKPTPPPPDSDEDDDDDDGLAAGAPPAVEGRAEAVVKEVLSAPSDCTKFTERGLVMGNPRVRRSVRWAACAEAARS